MHRETYGRDLDREREALRRKRERKCETAETAWFEGKAAASPAAQDDRASWISTPEPILNSGALSTCLGIFPTFGISNFRFPRM
jgi:hypothetical protein